MELGARFWLGVLGIAIAGVFGFLLFLEAFAWAWWHVGLIGALLLLSAILLLIGWITDRRTRKRYGTLEPEI